MKVYFAWTDQGQVYDPGLHEREDEKIFHLEISQKEGGFAQAKVIVQNKGVGLLAQPNKRYCHISFDNQHIFSGRLIGMPSHLSGELMAMIFTASPDNVERQSEEVKKDLMRLASYNSLFHKGYGSGLSLSQLLEAHASLPYWSRTSGKLSLSDLFIGRQQLDIGQDHFYHALQTMVTQDPLDGVEVALECMWLQQRRGSAEIAQRIKRSLKHGHLTTLSSLSLEQAWWKPGHKIAHTAYTVEDASLVRLHFKDETQKYTQPIWHWDEQPRQIKFNRYTYDIGLKIGWHYKQPRHEIARFTLKQSVQNISGAGKRTRKLHFSLAKILGLNHVWQAEHHYQAGFKVLYEGAVYKCTRTHTSDQVFQPTYWKVMDGYVHVDGQATRPTFFYTDEGKHAISYALEIAKAHLAASTRCVQIKIKGDLRKLCAVTLDHTLMIADSRLPGGRAQGKVAKYKFILDGKTGEKTAEVVLAASVGTGHTQHKLAAAHQCYAFDDVIVQDVYEGKSSSDLRFTLPVQYYPKAGLTTLGRLNEQDIVRDIKILHTAEQQEKELLARQYPQNMDMQQLLAEMPTDIHIKLLDLNTRECVPHEIGVDVLSTWSAPRQIDLS